MAATSNTVHTRVVCAMGGKRLIQKNCLQWCRTIETDSRMRVCAIYNIRFIRMNCVWLGNTMETVQMNKMFVIHGKQVRNQKYVRRLVITQKIAANKLCVLWANDWWYTIVNDWWNYHRQFPSLVRVQCDLLCLENNNMYTYKDTIAKGNYTSNYIGG